MLSLTLILLSAATEPGQPASASTPAATVEEPVPNDSSASVPPETVPDRAPSDPTATSGPTDPVTIQTPDGTRVVDLDDETSWEGLSSATKDKLRAERARRQANAQASAAPAKLDPDVPHRDSELPPIRSAPRSRKNGELEGYYDDKERELVITTAVLGSL